MTTLEIRYQKAIAKIGGAAKLLDLPEPIKEVLRNTRDIETKVKIMEAIADNI